MRLLLLSLFALYNNCSYTQDSQWFIKQFSGNINFRGLFAINDNIIWVSGSGGHVYRSTDQGNTWVDKSPAGFQKIDFRDIHAWDSLHAIIMGVSSPAYILKTTDGGISWKTVFYDTAASMFLDAMDFSKKGVGIVIGDPLHETPFIAVTKDYGNTWKTKKNFIQLNQGEAFFAASGSNIYVTNTNHFYAVTGGTYSRILRNNYARYLPVVQGKSMTGANSIAIKKYGLKTHMAIAAGNYDKPAYIDSNFIFSVNKGRTWHTSKKPPTGYRSCILFLGKKKLVTCGLTGVDISYNGGLTWQSISKTGYHVCSYATKGQYIFFAGRGIVGRYSIKNNSIIPKL